MLNNGPNFRNGCGNTNRSQWSQASRIQRISKAARGDGTPSRGVRFEIKGSQRREAATKWVSVVPSSLRGDAAASRKFRRSPPQRRRRVVAHKSHSSSSDHPVRSNKEASRHFLNVASTPPHKEGTTFAQQSSPKTGVR